MSNISDIFPFLKKGWVAMDEWGTWLWFSSKPVIRNGDWDCRTERDHCVELRRAAFNFKKAKNWQTSLMEVK